MSEQSILPEEPERRAVRVRLVIEGIAGYLVAIEDETEVRMEVVDES